MDTNIKNISLKDVEHESSHQLYMLSDGKNKIVKCNQCDATWVFGTFSKAVAR